jgi:hypothetical protein
VNLTPDVTPKLGVFGGVVPFKSNIVKFRIVAFSPARISIFFTLKRSVSSAKIAPYRWREAPTSASAISTPTPVAESSQKSRVSVAMPISYTARAFFFRGFVPLSTLRVSLSQLSESFAPPIP